MRYANTYEFCDGNINMFCSMLRKGVYRYEYKDSWGRFDETSLFHEEDFYSDFNMLDITDAGYKHAKKIWKEFKIKHLS